MDTISKRLKYYRSQKGFSATQVANQLGVAVSTYRDWEYGRQIGGEPYCKLAEILGVSMTELMFGPSASSEEMRKEIDVAIESLIRLKARI